MIDEVIKKLQDNEYVFRFEDKGIEYWSKQTRLASPLDKLTDSKVFVFVDIDKENSMANISADGHNGHYWVKSEATSIPMDYFIRNVRILEERVVYGWREIYQ